MKRLALIFFWWLSATASAFAADPLMTMTLTPQEMAAVIKSMDRQPISETPPAGFWNVQAKITGALDANPAGRAAVTRMFPNPPR